jgi:hypothetical protein
VLKSVIGSGAVFDRAALQAQLTNTRAPAQITGGIKTVEGLMGGRLNSMRHQWSSVGLPEEEWEAKLTPEAAEAIGPYMGKPKAETDGTQGQAAPKADTGGIPDWAQSALKAHPEKREDFDRKFGPGSAAKVLGQ